MKHISIRVPWHDHYWDGCICKNPSCNTFCTNLQKITPDKKDSEDTRAGRYWGDLYEEDRPPCTSENGGFMNPFSYDRKFTHVYAKNNGIHSVLKPTTVKIPPYAAFCTPFRYMLKNNKEMVDRLWPGLSQDMVPKFSTAWIYGGQRQKDILTNFKESFSDSDSFCVFYCKNGNPIDDEGRRMIIGIGEVTKLHSIYEYDTTSYYTFPLWEVIVEHSIRRDLKESQGFLIPYHQYLELSEEYVRNSTGLSKEAALDEIKLSLDKVGNSEQILNELSYGADFVSSRSMLIILEAARDSIEAVIRHKLVGGDWPRQLRWINASIAKVKTLISPFPAFADVLQAIGINYSNLIEMDIRKAGCGKKDNPWLYFERMLDGSLVLPHAEYMKEFPTYRDTWNHQTKETKELLQLLSRFEIDIDLIEEILECREDYSKIIENPYLISERAFQRGRYYVTTRTIDLGVMADPDIQGQWLPTPPSAVESVIDLRRLRSLMIERLCMALDEGDTLLSINEVEENLRASLLHDEKARLPLDIVVTAKPFFSEALAYIPETNPTAIQLKDYYFMEERLRSILSKRAKKNVRIPVTENWIEILHNDPHFDPKSERSVRAAEQQAKALEMMAAKRLSVLAGGAGTGKTAVVRSFLSSPTILKEGVLLLAPTGKARVRLGNMAQGTKGIDAKTVAQFLMRYNRYDVETMSPQFNEHAPKYSEARNIIIDECSMLTTKELYVLLEALDLSRINRIILIGDPGQLPPIGAGRPFSDLYNYLKKPDQEESLRNALTSLKIVVRTIGKEDSDILTLASWFSGEKPTKDADSIFDRLSDGYSGSDLRVAVWDNENELIEKLHNALCEELNCSARDLNIALKARLGTDNLKALSRNPSKLESLQILSPVRSPLWGVYQLNEYLQKWVGVRDSKLSSQFSLQQMYQGDKIMQLMNMRMQGFPSDGVYQLSNGQIGFVANIRERSKNSSYCNVTYTGIPNITFGFVSEKGEDPDVPIELAYAITVHKSQGSDFDTVFLVLPKSGRILSRELIYTALTRAKSKVILLIENNVNWLYEKSKPEASILARRNSGLFEYSVRDSKASIPFVEGLIHSTKKDSDGKSLLVRSKSEVIIANELITAGLKFKYEEPLTDYDRTYRPDFSFVDDSGDTIIWEHLGMLTVPEYKRAWEKKLKVYKELGFVEGETLFTTIDHPNGSIDTQEVLKVIDNIKDMLE